MNTVSANNRCENRYPYEEQYPQSISDSFLSENSKCVLKEDKNKIASLYLLPKNCEIDKLSLDDKKEEINKKPLDIAKSAAKNTKEMKRIVNNNGEEHLNGNNRPNIKYYLEAAQNIEDPELNKIISSVKKYNSTDCSGFINMIFKDSNKSLTNIMVNGEKDLGKTYDKNTIDFKKRYRGAELIRRGSNKIAKEDIKEGDLIFFKDIKNTKSKSVNNFDSGLELTDYATHIGIISKVEKRDSGEIEISFIHKSTNGGVVESSLNSRARVNIKIDYKDLDPTFGRIE